MWRGRERGVSIAVDGIGNQPLTAYYFVSVSPADDIRSHTFSILA